MPVSGTCCLFQELLCYGQTPSRKDQLYHKKENKEHIQNQVHTIVMHGKNVGKGACVCNTGWVAVNNYM